MSGHDERRDAVEVPQASGSAATPAGRHRVIELADALDGMTAGVIELLAAFGEVEPDRPVRLHRAA